MKDKIAAGLFAWVFGAFGGQWFYLGNKSKGIIYLLCFWIGLFLVLPSLIIYILSVIDGISLMTMEQQEFDRQYNADNRLRLDTNQLSALAKLKEEGVLTEDEFQQQKTRILSHCI